MRLCIVLPEWSKKMRWFRVYMEMFSGEGYDVIATNDPLQEAPCDVYLFMWADELLYHSLDQLPKESKVVVFLRRYEFYGGYWLKINWKRVSKLICLNPYYANLVKQGVGVDSEIVPNGVDLNKWSYKEHGHGPNIAVVGFINAKKNLPLAMQILQELPENYSLHFAGAIQEPVLINYLDNQAKRSRRCIYSYGQVEDLNGWFKGMDYLLCASVTEGCPNNVLEAMACGIKPLIHTWPGAEQFPEEYLFSGVRDAVEMINPSSPYNSKEYRQYIERFHGNAPYERVKQIVKELF